ncbi:transposase [Neolewinella agarilytica]|uniref:Transposase IS200 like n=1 Tax=Neolewinella agarilytica TaxID=478744 RepID=A0A1H9FUS9_9BACT|nr:transposase [Neolewinella agarilytica]SEQ41273.1 Transposase IS200 like [Neolewinella agarilytica]
MNTRPITHQLVHITYRLFDSINSLALAELGEQFEHASNEVKARYHQRDRQPTSLRHQAYRAEMRQVNMAYYLSYERLLDGMTDGPFFLADPRAKKIVIDSWLHIGRQYDLSIYAICVMSNHVHVLLRANDVNACIDLEMLMERHKRFTGRKINELHDAKGRRVWAEDPFDKDVRHGKFGLVLNYILNNPKKAGITDDILNFSGTWWDPRLEQEYITPLRRTQRSACGRPKRAPHPI